MVRSKDIFYEMQSAFLERCEQVESGNLSALDLATEFKEEMNFLEQLQNERKTWLNENLDTITDEAEQYPNSTYKGFKITKQVRETLNFKNIPDWQKIEEQKKEFEAKSKLGLQMIRKGIPNVDAETGEEIPLPEVSVTSFIKIEKAK